MTSVMQPDDQPRTQQNIYSMEGGTAIAEQINQIYNTYETMPEDVRESTLIQGLLSELAYVEKQLTASVLQAQRMNWRTALNENAERLLLLLMAVLFVVGVFGSISLALGGIALVVCLVVLFRRYWLWQQNNETARLKIPQLKQEVEAIHNKMKQVKSGMTGEET